jgi:hypothetical protein
MERIHCLAVSRHLHEKLERGGTRTLTADKQPPPDFTVRWIGVEAAGGCQAPGCVRHSSNADARRAQPIVQRASQPFGS